MSVVIFGIDLDKNSCGLVSIDGSGQIILRRRLKRQSLQGLVGDLPPCVVAM